MPGPVSSGARAPEGPAPGSRRRFPRGFLVKDPATARGLLHLNLGGGSRAIEAGGEPMKAIPAAMAWGVLLLSGCYSEPVVRVRIREPAPALTSQDVVKMAKSGISDSVIIDQIKSHGLESRPTADQIVSLKAEGLSDAVLQAMNSAPAPPPRERVVEYVDGYPYYPYYYPYPYYGPYWYGAFYWGYPYYYPYHYHPYYFHGPYYGSVHPYRH